MLTSEQRDAFDRLGFLHLRGAVPRTAVEAMCRRVWDVLSSEHAMHRDAPETWTVQHPTGFKALQGSGAFAEVGSRVVRDALDELVGRGAWQNTWRGGRVLATFRTTDRWDVPHESWHLDFNAPPRTVALPGVSLFTFLVPVAARGGGTLVVGGSHKLVAELAATARPADADRSG
jgi:hypothetical protein